VRTLPQLRADALLDLLSGRPFMLSPSLDKVTAAADQAARNLGYSNDDPDDLAGTQPPPTIRDRRGTRTARGGTARGSTSGPASSRQAHSDRESAATGAAGTGRDAGPAGGAGDGAQPGPMAQPVTGPDDGGLSDQDTGDDGGRYVSVDLDPIDVAAFEPEGSPDGTPDVADQRPRDDSPNPTVANPTTPSLPVPVASDDPRQCVCGGVQPAPRRGVVDLQMQLSTLMSLNDDPGIIPGWGPILADIARQVAYDQETNPAWKFSITDPDGNLLHHGHIRRRPNATEAAFVKARNGSCCAPRCRQPATTCDLDHRQEWANNGPSHRGNLDPACKHHHRLRHEHGFRIHHIHGGTYIWEAPNGMLYRVLPDASLMFAVHSDEPGPPHGYVNQYFPDEPLEDAYGRP
jgi:hypothetical protein